MIPKRRTFNNHGTKEQPQIRSASHLKWIRGHHCAITNDDCAGKIEAAHVRTGTDGGMGVKPGDNWTIPLCSVHHAWQHHHGEQSFERQYCINMKRLAEHMWGLSPHGRAWRSAHD